MPKAKRKRYLPLVTLIVGFVAPLSSLALYVYLAPEEPALPEETSLIDELMASAPYTKDDPVTTSVSKSADGKDIPVEVSFLYPETEAMKIKGVSVNASLARTWPERIKGLSGTSFLPEDVVKVFVFESPGFHSIWMKDMSYAIDIIWADETETIVHIVKNATPASYPETFSPDVPAVYVIETVEGFVARHDVEVGDTIELPASVR